MTGMTRTRAAAVLAAAVSAVVAGTVPAAAEVPEPAPVRGDTVVHDPSMIRAADGRYYVFSTHNGIEMRSSRDRITFARAGAALPDGVPWAARYTGGDPRELWAPDVSRHGGRYLLYFAASSFGSNHSAIGLAISATGLPGSWRDQGIVYSSDTTDDFNAIDPGLTVDAAGNWWLVFGSFWSGIKMIQLDPATGRQAAWNRIRYDLAQRPFPDEIEAPAVVFRGGFYYLFVSFDFCCRGVQSTYRIMVGRSRSITGPYLDRAGQPMTAGGGTELLATHGERVVGPGGQSVLGEGGQDLLVYHYYDRADNGVPKLGLNTLVWDAQGWPQPR